MAQPRQLTDTYFGNTILVYHEPVKYSGIAFHLIRVNDYRAKKFFLSNEEARGLAAYITEVLAQEAAPEFALDDAGTS